MNPNERLHRMQLQCRTLVEKPDLAALAKNFALHVHGGMAYVEPFGDVVLPCKSACRQALAECTMSPSRRKKIITGIFEEDEFIEYYYLALSRALCPNIRTLRITGSVADLLNSQTWKDTFKMTSEVLQIDPSHDDGALTMPVLSDLARMTGARMLSSATSSDGRPNPVGNAHLPPMPIKIEVLALRDFRFTHHELGATLCYARLRSINIEFAVPQHAHRDDQWRRLGDALRMRTPELQSLRLDYARSSLNVDHTAETRGRDVRSIGLQGLGDLRGFTKLTDLVASENALRGTRSDPGKARRAYHEILPNSLRRLTIIFEDNVVLGNVSNTSIDGATLEELTLMNFRKDHWFSSKHGEGWAEPLGNPVPKLRRLHSKDHLKEKQSTSMKRTRSESVLVDDEVHEPQRQLRRSARHR